MNSKRWKLFGVAAVTLAVVGTGLVFTMSSQAATSVSLPAPGTICVKLAAMGHTFNPFGGTSGPFAATQGQITAQVGQPIKTSDGRQGFNFSVIDFKSTGNVTGLGNVAITLDTSRKPDVSTFVANTSGQDNTQTINFFVNVGVNGKSYHSAGQVTLVGTSVASFPPPPGTAYALVKAVDLVDATGKAAYTLPVGQAATIQ